VLGRRDGQDRSQPAKAAMSEVAVRDGASGTSGRNSRFMCSELMSLTTSGSRA